MESIVVSSAAELEVVIRDLSVEFVRFSVPSIQDLAEASLLFRRLKQACLSRPGWEVEDASWAALQKGSNRYDKVNLLELRLGVLKLEVADVEDGIAVRNLRRKILMEENPKSLDMVTIPEQIDTVLDSVSVEVERVERTASNLGFTGSVAVDTSDSASTEVEDLDQENRMKYIVKKIEGLLNLLQKIKSGEQLDVTRK